MTALLWSDSFTERATRQSTALESRSSVRKFHLSHIVLWNVSRQHLHDHSQESHSLCLCWSYNQDDTNMWPPVCASLQTDRTCHGHQDSEQDLCEMKLSCYGCGVSPGYCTRWFTDARWLQIGKSVGSTFQTWQWMETETYYGREVSPEWNVSWLSVQDGTGCGG